MHNTPKQSGTASAPFIDHIRGRDGKDDDKIFEILGKDSYDTRVKFVFVEKENERKDDNETSFPISKSFLHNPDCSPRHECLRRFFAF